MTSGIKVQGSTDLEACGQDVNNAASVQLAPTMISSNEINVSIVHVRNTQVWKVWKKATVKIFN